MYCESVGLSLPRDLHATAHTKDLDKMRWELRISAWLDRTRNQVRQRYERVFYRVFVATN
jgi:hypothetical protein